MNSLKLFSAPGRYLVLCVLGSLFILSCHPVKGLKKSTSGTSETELVHKFLHPPAIQFLSGKAKVTININGESRKANVFIRNRKDSAIWMLVKKSSVEGGRTFVTPDSFYFMNRIDKEYFMAPLDTLLDLYGIQPDFAYLQNMLTGIPPGDTQEENLAISKTSRELRINTVISGTNHQFIYNLKSGFYTGGRIISEAGLEAEWVFDKYRIVGDSLELPHFRQYVFYPNENESIILTMEFSDIETGEAKTIRFEIPGHYTRMD